MYDPKVRTCRSTVRTDADQDIFQAFKAETASWRAVIQLNVVRSIHLILNAMERAQVGSRSLSLNDSSDDSSNHLPHLSPELQALQIRLLPLLQVEQMLTRRLTPLNSGEYEPTQLSHLPYTERSKLTIKELAVNSTAQWKNAFSRIVRREGFDRDGVVDWDESDDPGLVLHSCSDDMVRLWADPTVHQLLDKQNLRLEEMAGL
jgi:guanine nucleotide-binding protein subunit alpha